MSRGCPATSASTTFGRCWPTSRGRRPRIRGRRPLRHDHRVTLVADAAPAFRAAVGRGRAATVLRLLPVADPWSPALLARTASRAGGGRTRRTWRRPTAAGANRQAGAAVVAGGMPAHLRASLHAHIRGMLAAHEGALPPPPAPAGVAARSPGAGADAAAGPAGGVSHPPGLVDHDDATPLSDRMRIGRRAPISAAPVSAAASGRPRRRRAGSSPPPPTRQIRRRPPLAPPPPTLPRRPVGARAPRCL
ncbi:hypothetical protein BU14_1007s0004 [Porphyra umbilicalis]|uniref:Uncharacterized protein n=1 Tax=Porphyra umbilicalis TaxID=2786 RepID=A0A1X6NN58_PORUM|nr:hypothetical protein BU14_1007s0004 [Porphyra umbilicalis]|eukprot:OSX69926.1 hypothetical protein BU14_1007s0004 [Porphyra umbilicalis]